jgi:hypothetical protein
MASLVERAQDVRVRLVDRDRKKAGQQLAQRLTTTIKRSTTTAQRLDNALSLARTLRAENVGVPSIDRRTTEPAKKARTSLRSTATKLEPSDLEDEHVLRILDSPAFQDALKASDEIVDRLAGSLAKALEAERTALLPEGVDEPLTEVPGAASILFKLKNSQLKLTTATSLTAESLSSDGLQLILQGRTKRADAAREWPALYATLTKQIERQHPEVQAFLRAVAGPDGAGLELLTEEVQSHLEESGTLENYRIQPS